VPNAQNSSSYPNYPYFTPIATKVRTETTTQTPRAVQPGVEVPIGIYSPTPYQITVAPELLFSPTSDPNSLSITVKIDQQYSREEIARILFSRWLEHYLSNEVSLEMRLSDYKINKITIPDDQHCANKLGALFMAEAEVTATTAMPAQAPIGQYSSRWMVSAGGYVSESETQRTILFKSAISKLGDEYTLTVIMQAPMCD
jgi:hypothetical protein